MSDAHTDETDPMLEEKDEVKWRRYLAQFRDEVFPVFEEQGVGFEAALTVWWLNRVANRILDVENAVTGDNET